MHKIINIDYSYFFRAIDMKFEPINPHPPVTRNPINPH